MGTYQKLGYLSGDRLVVLDVKRRVDMFRRDPKTGEVTPLSAEPDVIEQAISYYEGADYLHKHHLDRRIVGD